MKPTLEFFRPLGFINWLLSPGVAGIDPGTAILIAGGASLAGGLIGGSSTAKAQEKANQTNAAIAAQQARDAYNNWLVSRGVNPGLAGLPSTATLVAKHPELKVEWERVRALGDKRDFDTWLQDHVAENPSDYIAEELGSTAVNTKLPLWATTNGQPTEQFLLNSILQRSGLSTPQTEAAYSMEQALAGAQDWEIQWWQDRANEYGVDSIGAAMARWYAENPNDVKKPFEAAVLAAYSKPAFVGPVVNTPATAVDPRIISLQDQAVTQAGKVYDGSLLAEEMAALDPVLKARSQAAELQFARNDELRSRIADMYAAESAGAGGVRDASTAAARGLFDASVAGAGGVRDASTAAARGLYDAESSAAWAIRDALMGKASHLYDAEVSGAGTIYDAAMLGAGRLRDAQLTSADVYGSQALEAVNRVLAQNDARRRLQGFSGGSSFDDISRARTLAPALTEGALYRTKAEESYAKMFADAEAAKARALATAGTGRATSEGSASEEYARLLAAAGIRQSGSIGNAGIDYSKALATAGVNQAGSIGNAGIDYSKALATAGVNQAGRLGQVLDTDAAIGRENANLQNALDKLQITTADITRRNTSGGAAGALSSQGRQLTTDAQNNAFADIDAVLARMGLFSSNNSTPPTTAAATVQPTINSGQILGSALSSLGQMGMDYWTTQSLINSMKSGTKTIDTTGGQNSYWWLDPKG